MFVQENFELYHETLYLAVKMTDHYLSQTHIHRDMLQLVGSTAMLVACKFEVRAHRVCMCVCVGGLGCSFLTSLIVPILPCSCSPLTPRVLLLLQERSPPCVDDFLYICDDAYKKEELIAMEQSLLTTLSFDISIPIPYRFLRRYAKVGAGQEGVSTVSSQGVCHVGLCRCSPSWVFASPPLQCVSAGMDTLTLARYYCEMSLLEMDLVVERGSLVASACLLMALVTKDLGGWVGSLIRLHITGVQLKNKLNKCNFYPISLWVQIFSLHNFSMFIFHGQSRVKTWRAMLLAMGACPICSGALSPGSFWHYFRAPDEAGFPALSIAAGRWSEWLWLVFISSDGNVPVSIFLPVSHPAVSLRLPAVGRGSRRPKALLDALYSSWGEAEGNQEQILT